MSKSPKSSLSLGNARQLNVLQLHWSHLEENRPAAVSQKSVVGNNGGQVETLNDRLMYLALTVKNNRKSSKVFECLVKVGGR